MQSVFFVFYLYFFVFLLYFYKKKYEKIEKKYEKIRMQLLKNTKYKKKRINNFKNTKYKKKNTNPKFQKYNIQRKDKFKNKPKSQPRVHCGNQETNCKKIQNQPLVFSKPCNSDFVFLICLFFVFFLFLNMGRRPFCSHRGLLKYNLFALETFKRSTNFQWGSPLGCLSDLSGFGSPGALRFSRIDRALRLSHKEEL